MRRWLPIALLLAAAAIVALVARWHTHLSEPIAATGMQAPAARSPALPTDELARSDTPEGRRAAGTLPQVATQLAHVVDPGMAQLLVHVRGKTKRTPVVDSQVTASPDRPEDHDYSSATLDTGVWHASGETDAAGTATLEVRPGIRLSISVTVMDRRAAGVVMPVSALQPGQRMEIDAELPDGNDAQVFGRVVAAETRAAIDGARVACIDAWPGFSTDGTHWGVVELAQASTGPDGTFELDYPSWRTPHLRIEAQGFGVRLSEPLKENSDAGHPLVIELARSASLRAHLIGADGLGLDALRVELSAEGTDLIPEDQKNRADVSASFPNERWESKTDRGGWVSFPDLPAQTSISAYVHMGARVVKPEVGGVELAPGEAKEVEWRMGAGCAVSGLVLDTDGKPVTRTQIWLAQAWEGGAPYFSSEVHSLLQQVATTNMEGRFEMPGVPRGEWFIGPAPDGPRYANESSIAPMAERVVIGNERSKEVSLRVQRGLYVRGRVLDPDGKPISGSSVEVGDDAHHSMLSSPGSERDGRFEVGPLPAGAVWLTARGFRCVDSVPVRAQAGTSGVELRLRRGGTIRGRVVDAASGEGMTASLEFVLEGSDSSPRDGWTQWGTEDDGTFESPPLLAGAYSVGAMTDDGRFGFVKGIGVSLGAEHADVLVQVKPGGALRLTYSGSADTVWGRIVADGVTLGSTGPIRKDKQLTLRLPAGVCVLELTDEHEHVVRKEITLQAGETRELVLTEKE